MAITKNSKKGSALSKNEVDANFQYLDDVCTANSAAIAGHEARLDEDSFHLLSLDAQVAEKASQAQVNDLTAQVATKAEQAQVNAHIGNTDNPHGVTRAQVGLANADNTADVDKPVSTPQAAAIANAAFMQGSVSKTASYALTSGDGNKMVYLESAGVSANATFTLPDLTTITGEWHGILANINATYTLTVAAFAGQSIGGDIALAEHQAAVIAKTGNGWSVVVKPSTSGGASSSYDIQTFNTSGTWTKPVSGTFAIVECWGGGGSGGVGSESGGSGGTLYSGGGGGGGNYATRIFSLADLASTVSVTVGTGGAGVATPGNDGFPGANTTFGSYLIAHGGQGGGCVSDKTPQPYFYGGGGGGGRKTVSYSTYTDYLGGVGGWGAGDGGDSVSAGSIFPSKNRIGGSSYYGGGGGGAVGGSGGNSMYGGGGGGGGGDYSGFPSVGGGGQSKYGGAGSGGQPSAISGGNGATPGGGSGGVFVGVSSGSGGNGLCIVRVF